MSELEQQIENRRRKRRRLEEAGLESYPARLEYDLEPRQVQAEHGGRTAEELAAEPLALRVPGRIRSIRSHGKTVFLDLHDGAEKLQVMARLPALDETSALVLENLDLGDFVLAAGPLIRTRTGELTIAAERLAFLAKAMRPLPEKWHGLTDVEARFRQRYLDLLHNRPTRDVFEVRAALIRGMRSFLDRHGFLEVETPMMQPIPGGATARPFVTHHNALDLELYLRIAPELYLKRLLVGGLHRVYEINRNFRNEGISTQHNPEFTMLEFYWAYADYRRLMDFTEEMLHALAVEVLERPALVWDGQELDLTPPWPRYTMREAVVELGGVPAASVEHAADLAAIYAERGLALPAALGTTDHPLLRAGSRADFEREHPGREAPEGWYGHLLYGLFEALVEHRLVRPTFVTELPVEISPLSKLGEDRRFVERFELFAAGMEIANAYSELNDPEEQARRFREQIAALDRGDEEAHRYDHDYVLALEHGMPPAGGEGIGIDRLTMLFTDTRSIRDVILFPLLRPIVDDGEASGGEEPAEVPEGPLAGDRDGEPA